MDCYLEKFVNITVSLFSDCPNAINLCFSNIFILSVFVHIDLLVWCTFIDVSLLLRFCGLSLFHVFIMFNIIIALPNIFVHIVCLYLFFPILWANLMSAYANRGYYTQKTNTLENEPLHFEAFLYYGLNFSKLFTGVW